MKKSDISRIASAVDKKVRTASEKSIVNSVLDDDKLRLMMKVCKHTPKWLNSLENKMYETIAPLKCEAWVTPEPVTFENRENGKHRFKTHIRKKPYQTMQ